MCYLDSKQLNIYIYGMWVAICILDPDLASIKRRPVRKNKCYRKIMQKSEGN